VRGVISRLKTLPGVQMVGADPEHGTTFPVEPIALAEVAAGSGSMTSACGAFVPRCLNSLGRSGSATPTARFGSASRSMRRSQTWIGCWSRPRPRQCVPRLGRGATQPLALVCTQTACSTSVGLQPSTDAFVVLLMARSEPDPWLRRCHRTGVESLACAGLRNRWELALVPDILDKTGGFL
jgi:hypothetical protein